MVYTMHYIGKTSKEIHALFWLLSDHCSKCSILDFAFVKDVKDGWVVCYNEPAAAIAQFCDLPPGQLHRPPMAIGHLLEAFVPTTYILCSWTLYLTSYISYVLSLQINRPSLALFGTSASTVRLFYPKYLFWQFTTPTIRATLAISTCKWCLFSRNH